MTNKIYFKNYIQVDNILNSDNICVLMHKLTKKLYIQKILNYYNLEIYTLLKSHHIKNTPKIIDFILINNNLVILREYIEGNTLDDYLHNNNYTTELFYKHIFELCNTINNLQNIKNVSIIHRDIKPENIIIDNSNELYLIDLNAAKFYNQNETRDTELIGTPNYAAPEQYGFGSSNKSTDIYAIGKLIEYMSSFIKDSYFNKKISIIIQKCCQIDYRDRYKNIFELKLDIFKIKHRIIDLLIPGFRSFNFIHMTIAFLAYFLIIYLSFFYTYCNNIKINISLFLMCISFIFVFFDYLNVNRFLPFTNSKNTIIKYLIRFIYSIIIPIIVYLVLINTF